MDNKITDEFIRKNVTSAFIYPIHALEEKMGFLWGEHKSEEEQLTPEEQKFFDLFMEWRKLVLDYGNMVIRRSKNEMRKLKSREENHVS